ncbi:MAG: carboxypeptidase regulatory-like domain-containing protein [Candidatus Eremiobacterota bacterium]
MRPFLTLFLACSLFGVALAGDIQGTITIKSRVPPRAVGPKRVRIGQNYPDRDGGKPCAPVDEALFAVVFLCDPSGRLKASPETDPDEYPTMRQKGTEFLPHVLPVVSGSTVRFTNEDDIYHHIYSPGGFEIPKYKGRERTQKFDKPGAVEIFCGIHPRMNAYILVTENDYFANVDSEHRFRLRDVPPGRYTLRVWHPRLKAVERAVEVPAGGTLTVDLTL